MFETKGKILIVTYDVNFVKNSATRQSTAGTSVACDANISAILRLRALMLHLVESAENRDTLLGGARKIFGAETVGKWDTPTCDAEPHQC